MVIKVLDSELLIPGLMDGFIRYQETTRVFYSIDEQRAGRVENYLGLPIDQDTRFAVKDDFFINDWGPDMLSEIIQDFADCVGRGGYAVGAFVSGGLVGFANLESRRFGPNGEYVEMPFIHVSAPYRGQGVGRRLFARCTDAARNLGAGKIYISTHPAVETQAFYHRLGCIPAADIEGKILQKEPLDMQLEMDLASFQRGRESWE